MVHILLLLVLARQFKQERIQHAHATTDFFNERENLKIDDPYQTLACFGFRKPAVLPSIIRTFSMFFHARYHNTFFNPPADTLCSRIRIFTNFGASTNPKLSF